jgi:hypothetical protein
LAGLFSGLQQVLLAAGPEAQKSSANDREIGPLLSTLNILHKLRIIK